MDAGARLSDQDGALNDVPKDKANLAGIPAAACPRKRSAAVVDLEKLLDIKLSRKPSFAEVLSSARRSRWSNRNGSAFFGVCVSLRIMLQEDNNFYDLMVTLLSLYVCGVNIYRHTKYALSETIITVFPCTISF